MGGIYGSTVPGQSGIAVFGQYTVPAPTPANTSAPVLAVKSSVRALTMTASRGPASVATSGVQVGAQTSSTVAPVALAPDAHEMDAVTNASNQKIYKYFYGKRKVLTVH